MSEQCSLYIKVRISKEDLDAFLKARPIASTINSNWLEWWDSRVMHSKMDLKNIPAYIVPTNGDFLEDILEDKYIVARQAYKDGYWYLLGLQFSENYTEILPMISWIKDLAAHLEPDAKGVAFIYDYLWGDKTVMAYIEISEKLGKLSRTSRTTEINQEVLKEANEMFEILLNSLEDKD
ncbi:hypothetical protein [Sphingobacterium mizutaii]|uniref:hypothetical protein n=1 Tax=Sphingobacterium mizutaii TaxID=1010 RepID=UPI001625C022|nr:hypothetical protein [Sphingobacterium mizutaii]